MNTDMLSLGDYSSYGETISRAVSGIVPDVGSALNEAPTVTPLGGDVGAIGSAGAVTGGDSPRSFKDTVKQFLGDVNDKMVTSQDGMRDLAMGKRNDLDTVVTSVEEANLAFSFTQALRSKVLDAYQEISRMQI